VYSDEANDMPDALKQCRQRRRDDRARMKRRAVRAYPDWPAAFKAADHLCVCSSACCGNPRHHAHSQRARLTMQERRHVTE